MKHCYLQTKICATIPGFRETLVAYGVHELHCGIAVYEKHTLASIFK